MTRTPDNPSPYRWIIVAIAAAMLAVSMGQLVNGLSAFFTPLEDEFGWGRGEIAFINTAGLMGIALGGVIMGFAADRLDMRRVVLVGAAVTALGMIAASAARELWQLYAIFFVTGAFGGGALFAPLFALVGAWFRTGAGLAIGVVAAGQAIGQGGIPFANAILIGALGWRGALLALGLVSLAVLVPLALLVRVPPPVRLTVGGNVAETEPPIPVRWIVALMSFAVLCCCSLMSVPLMHLVPLVQGCGIPAPEAGSVVFVMMLAAIAGRVAFGRLADAVGAVQAYLAASAWQTALVFFFTRIDDLSLFYIFAPVYGFGYAGVMTGVLTTIRSLVPAARRASASGIILAFAWAGHGLGGYVGGVFFDMTGTYDLTFAVAVAAGVANLIVVGLLFVLVARGEQPGAGLVATGAGAG